MSFVNQYSFLLMATLLIGAALWWAAAGDWSVTRLVMVALLAVAMVVMGVWVRREATTTPLPTVLTGGQPVLVEYYSDF